MPSATSLLLAVTLLTTPPDTPEPLPSPEEWPALQAALVAVAIDWEVLDRRETRYVFARLEDFEDNLNLVRRRYRDLRDAPLLSDCQRFPDHRTVNELLGFNRAYRRQLDARQPLDQDRGDLLRAALRETDELYQVWDSVRDARCEYYYVTVRRQALKRLRCLLGCDDYATGALPPFVPIWRFGEN
jgi:hypothetical protein